MTDGVDALLDRWHVVAEGSVVRTATSRLVLGRRGDRAVVLEVAPDEEERPGARLLEWWAGRGAVRVLARAGDAVLLERLAGPRDLAAMSAAGEDDAAARVLAETAVRLHANGVPAPRDAVGLRVARDRPEGARRAPRLRPRERAREPRRPSGRAPGPTAPRRGPAAGLDETVLRDWTAAWCGLSLARAADDEPTWHARSCRAVAGRLLAD